MPLLAKTAENYLLLNPNECVAQADDAARYPLHRVEAIISDHTLRLRGDVQMQFVLRWLDADLPKRHAHFQHLLSYMRVLDLSLETVCTQLDTEPAFVDYGVNRLALYNAFNDAGLLIPDSHSSDYTALLAGKTDAARVAGDKSGGNVQ
jgi:hypothetical protein